MSCVEKICNIAHKTIILSNFSYFPICFCLLLIGEYIVFGIVLCLPVMYLLVFVGVDHYNKNRIEEGFKNFRSEISKNWTEGVGSFQSAYRQFSCKNCKNFTQIIKKILIIISYVFLNSPLVILIWYILLKHRVFRIERPFFKLFIGFFITIIVVFPATWFAQIIMLLVALAMYHAPILLNGISAVADLIIYIKQFMKNVAAKHDACLEEIITRIKKHNTEKSNLCLEENPSEQGHLTLKFYMPTEANESEEIAPTEGRLECIGCIPYFLDGNKICVNKNVIFHCMTKTYVQGAVKLAAISAFLMAVCTIVYLIGTFEYISLGNQVFMTLALGVLPLLIQDIFRINQDPSSLHKNNTTDKTRISEFDDLLKTYSETWVLGNLKSKNKNGYVAIEGHCDSSLQAE